MNEVLNFYGHKEYGKGPGGWKDGLLLRVFQVKMWDATRRDAFLRPTPK
jgi:hypothetical protein